MPDNTFLSGKCSDTHENETPIFPLLSVFFTKEIFRLCGLLPCHISSLFFVCVYVKYSYSGKGRKLHQFVLFLFLALTMLQAYKMWVKSPSPFLFSGGSGVRKSGHIQVGSSPLRGIQGTRYGHRHNIFLCGVSTKSNAAKSGFPSSSLSNGDKNAADA